MSHRYGKQPAEGSNPRVKVVHKKRRFDGSRFSNRFVNDTHKSFYDKHYATTQVVHEKAISQTQLDPGFWNTLEARGWSRLRTIRDAKVNETIAREFCANLNGEDLDQGFVMVRGVSVPFSPEVINFHYGFPPRLDMTYIDTLRLLEETHVDWREELRMLLCPETAWTVGAGGRQLHLPFKAFSDDHMVICHFINNRLLPKHGSSRFTIEDLGLLYALQHGFLVDVVGLKYRIFESHLTDRTRCIVLPCLIYSRCLGAGVLDEPSDVFVANPRPIRRERNIPAAQPAEQPAHPPPQHRYLMSNEERCGLSLDNSMRNFLQDHQARHEDLVAVLMRLHDQGQVPDRRIFDAHSREYRFTVDIEARMTQIRPDEAPPAENVEEPAN